MRSISLFQSERRTTRKDLPPQPFFISRYGLIVIILYYFDPFLQPLTYEAFFPLFAFMIFPASTHNSQIVFFSGSEGAG